MSAAALVEEQSAALESEILDYVAQTGKIAAADLLEQVAKKHPDSSRADFVAAVWRLNEKSKVRIGSDWVIVTVAQG